MRDVREIDYYSDLSLIDNPSSYFSLLREQGPVVYLPRRNVVAVTGFEEGLPIFSDHEHFSAINIATGPIPPLPFAPEGDDISGQIDAYRDGMPFSATIVAEDPPQHGKSKSLLMGIITPTRLKENEQFIWQLADQLLDEFIEKKSFEAIADYGRPFATLVIADLMGVPAEDQPALRDLQPGVLGEIGAAPATMLDPLMELGAGFLRYIEDRRREPRRDVLTKMALATYKDGSTPDPIEVAKTATLVFGAGQHTTVILIAAAFRILAERPELQETLRNDRSLIPNFLEEVLRLEGAVKVNHRLVRKTTRIGDVEVPAGTNVMLALGAMNRDPRHFENPDELRIDRKNAREHVTFGRGLHACIGAPLARAEGRITLERFFDRVKDLRLDERKHGPQDARRFAYEQSYVLRGLKELHLEFG